MNAGRAGDLRQNNKHPDDREARLGEALRENLRKRKAVERARKARGDANDIAAEGTDTQTTPTNNAKRP